MVRAFVMVTTAAGEAEAVFSVVTALDAVREAHVVAGTYDLIAEVDGDEVYDVLDAAASEIGHLDGVEETRTYVSLN
ncbi:MAG: Lrp/AsnC ligand binding domain-containing protein [Halobacteriaceae archaeon]